MGISHDKDPTEPYHIFDVCEANRVCLQFLTLTNLPS